VASLHATIASLGSGQAVLVAFDYDPSTSGELDLPAQAILSHLMDQGMRIVTVSLLPAGPATAQHLLDELASERPDYAGEYGQRYANLGYMPGEATAVRLLGQSLDLALARDFHGTPITELPVMEGLTSIKDFRIIVELAAEQSTLRAWIEQAGTPYNVPMGAGVAASVEPLARAYSETDPPQLVGLLGGVPGAAMYASLQQGQDGPEGMAAVRLDALLAGSLALILLLLIGNGIYLSRRATGRER
jgi:hypothetical protein